MPSSVSGLVQRLVDRVAAADPVVATQLGMAEHAGELPDFSAPALAAYLADVKGLLGRLDTAAATSAGDEAIDAVTGGQIARRVVRAFETRRVQHAKPSLYLDAAYGVLLLMIKEIGSPAERVEAMAGRLRALPGVLEEGLANLRDPLPLPFVATGLADVPGVIELVGEAAPRAAADLGLPGALDEPARRASAAVARFGEELRRRYLPTATPRVSGGRELLVDLLAHEHLLRETPEEIAAVGRAAELSTISTPPHASAATTRRSHPSVAETRSCGHRELKRIPRRFHQIALQIRFCRWPHINLVRFCWPGGTSAASPKYRGVAALRPPVWAALPTVKVEEAEFVVGHWKTPR